MSKRGLGGQIESKNTGGSLCSPAGKEILGTDVMRVCSLFIQLCRRSLWLSKLFKMTAAGLSVVCVCDLLCNFIMCWLWRPGGWLVSSPQFVCTLSPRLGCCLLFVTCGDILESYITRGSDHDLGILFSNVAGVAGEREGGWGGDPDTVTSQVRPAQVPASLLPPTLPFPRLKPLISLAASQQPVQGRGVQGGA